MCKPPNGWMGEWVDSTRMLNLMTAFGYTFVAPPKCLSADSHLFFALRIPRTARFKGWKLKMMGFPKGISFLKRGILR